MVEVCNTGPLPTLVQGYWLYPGETRSVPVKVAQRLVDTNPYLALPNPVQPLQQAHTEAAVELAPDDQSTAAETAPRRRGRK